MSLPGDETELAAGNTLPSPGEAASPRKRPDVRIEQAPAALSPLAFSMPGNAAETLPAPPSAEGSPTSTGVSALKPVGYASYAILAEVASGGIGRILRARDTYLDRPVALKEMLRSDAATEERFVREARITARLQHPSIVPVYEAGRWPSGEPFYAMKLVSGQSFDKTIEAARTLDQRLALLPHVIAVAEAMAYAHGERIVHRDLKPHNVLTGPFGETVVIDWGLAKDLSDEEERTSIPEGPPSSAMRFVPAALTMVGAVVGTPSYMPPEQAEGRAVDERADVYAIGAILYHVLAGHPPYDAAAAKDILKAVLAGPPPPIEHVQPGVPRDLATIVHKAMARKGSSRYRTAAELAEDLRRFQTGQIVEAHHYSKRERLLRFAQKNRRVLFVTAAALAALSATAALSVQRIVEARDDARHERDRAALAEAREASRADRLTLVSARAAVARDPLESLAWLKTLSPSFHDARRARLVAGDAISRGIPLLLRGHTSGINNGVFSPDGQKLATSSDDHTVRLWEVGTGKTRVLEGHGDEAWSLAFSPDGATVVSGSKDGEIRAWNVGTGESFVVTRSEAAVADLWFSSDGRLVSRDRAGKNAISSLATKVVTPLPSPPRTDGFDNGDVSRDGRTLAFVSENALVLVDLATGASRRIPGHDKPPSCVGLSPDGALAVTGDTLGGVLLWDLRKDARPEPFDGHDKRVRQIRWFRDGLRFVTASADGAIRISDVHSKSSRLLAGHDGSVYQLAFSPNEKTLASAGADSTTRLWDVTSGTSRVLRGAKDGYSAVDFSPRGDWLLATSFDGSARLYSMDAMRDRILGLHDDRIHTLAASPDGKYVASASEGGMVVITNVIDGNAVPLGRYDGLVRDLSFSPDGKTVAAALDDGRIMLASPGRPETNLTWRGVRVNGVVFSADCALVVSAGEDGAIRSFPTSGGEARVLLRRNAGAISIAVSPDSRTLAAGFSDGTLVLYDLQTGKETLLEGHRGPVSALAFSPSGRVIGSGGADHSLRLWDVSSGQSKHVIDAAGTGIQKLVFFPDETRIVSIGGEANARIFGVADGRAIAVLRGHRGVVQSVSVSPDGSRVATAGFDGVVRLWDLTLDDSRILEGHRGPVNAVAFVDGGRAIVSAGDDHTVRRFLDDLPTEMDALRAAIDTATPETVQSLGVHLDEL